MSHGIRLVLVCSALLLGCDGNLRLFSELAGQAGEVGVGGGGGALVVGGTDGTEAGSVAAGGSASRGEGGLGGQADAGGAGPGLGLTVDDFEDRDTRAEPPLGWWYKVNDGTGTQTFSIEPSGDKLGGAYALHSAGTGFTGWGAVLGVNFAGESLIDVSGWGALAFWAFAEPGTNGSITIDLIASGDVRHYAPMLSLSDGWAQYRVPLADFEGKDQTPLDATMLQGMQFEIAAGAEFSLWLDDVEFVP